MKKISNITLTLYIFGEVIAVIIALLTLIGIVKSTLLAIIVLLVALCLTLGIAFTHLSRKYHEED